MSDNLENIYKLINSVLKFEILIKQGTLDELSITSYIAYHELLLKMINSSSNLSSKNKTLIKEIMNKLIESVLSEIKEKMDNPLEEYNKSPLEETVDDSILLLYEELKVLLESINKENLDIKEKELLNKLNIFLNSIRHLFYGR